MPRLNALFLEFVKILERVYFNVVSEEITTK